MADDDKTNPIGAENWERELDAATAADDVDLFSGDHGHPDDADPMGDGITVGDARKYLHGDDPKQ